MENAGFHRFFRQLTFKLFFTNKSLEKNVILCIMQCHVVRRVAGTVQLPEKKNTRGKKIMIIIMHRVENLHRHTSGKQGPTGSCSQRSEWTREKKKPNLQVQVGRRKNSSAENDTPDDRVWKENGRKKKCAVFILSNQHTHTHTHSYTNRQLMASLLISVINLSFVCWWRLVQVQVLGLNNAPRWGEKRCVVAAQSKVALCCFVFTLARKKSSFKLMTCNCMRMLLLELFEIMFWEIL